jgi:hypothetical protein
VSSSNPQACLDSIFPGSEFPWLIYLGGSVHRVHHLHFQDIVGKSPNVNPKNEFLETYCTPVLCSPELVY